MTETTTDSGLRYTDIETGDGETVTGRGQTVIVHYTGWLEDGTKFDSSRDRSDPFSFPVDCSYVIRGWDEGVKGMQVGGKRELTIAPDLAYGTIERPNIPANSTLFFEVELLGIVRGDAPDEVPAALGEPAEDEEGRRGHDPCPPEGGGGVRHPRHGGDPHRARPGGVRGDRVQGVREPRR